MENRKTLYTIVNILCVVLFVGGLLGLGLLMNVLLLPVETVPTEPSAPTEPPTEPPTEAPTIPALSIPDVTISAEHSFLYIMETDQFLMLRGEADDRIYPASITKLFSAYVALMYMEPDEIVKAGSEVYAISEDASHASISPGDKLTVRQLVEAMLLPSGNDAAMALATAVGRRLAENDKLSYSKAIARFVEEMNHWAVTFGLTGTHFENPDGYHHKNHYTTCHDMQKIARMVLTDKTLRQVMATEKVVVDLKKDYPGGWKNTNLLLQPSSKYYISTAIGMKTGYTKAAGYCLMSAFFTEGQTIVVGVFGCPEMTDRFVDAGKIYDAYTAK